MTDQVIIRTDDGVIKARVTEFVECDRPENGARLGGHTIDGDDPKVHYVDYWHEDDARTDGGRREKPDRTRDFRYEDL